MSFLKVKNRAYSTLASGVDDDDTEWALATGEGSKFPTSGDFHVTCEDEIAKCTSRSGDVLTVTRAQEGTSAAAHAAGKAVELRITAGIIEEIQNELDGGIDKTNLSQDFGPSSARLLNLILTPLANAVLQIDDTKNGPFAAKINGAPSATEVVYDTDSNEDFFNGLQSGASWWGRIVLHNTTRGNSRKVVSVDRGTNTITTESSTDDWADDDNITTQSQTNTYAGYFDVDLSASVPSTWTAILINAVFYDRSGVDQALRDAFFHPYEDTDWGKAFALSARGADQSVSSQLWIHIISQKITMLLRSTTDASIWFNVAGHAEYADT
jgi:hypothetical protein